MIDIRSHTLIEGNHTQEIRSSMYELWQSQLRKNLYYWRWTKRITIENALTTYSLIPYTTGQSAWGTKHSKLWNWLTDQQLPILDYKYQYIQEVKKSLNNRYSPWATQTPFHLFLTVLKETICYNKILSNNFLSWRWILHSWTHTSDVNLLCTSILTRSWTKVSHTQTANSYDPFFCNHNSNRSLID